MKNIKLYTAAFALLFHVQNILHAQSPLWSMAESATGTGYDDAYSVAVDAGENIYSTGYFTSPSLDFGAQSISNNGGADIFLVKYDGNNNFNWAIAIGSTGDEYGNAVHCDAFGNIYIVGTFTSSTLIFGNDTLVNSTGLPDIFIAKFDVNGNLIWAKREGCSDYDIATGITSSAANGDIYISGAFYSSNIVVGNDTLINNGLYDLLLMRIDSSGSNIWAKSSGGNYNDLGNSIALDQLGNIYMSGGFASDSISFDTTTLINAFGTLPDIFVAKYDANGNSLWALREGGVDNDHSVSVDTDANGNVLVAGHYHSLSFVVGTTTLTNSGMGDIFLLKYDALGNPLWAYSTGGADHDFAYSVTTDASGNVYLCGMFMSMSMSFGVDVLLNASMNEDMFLFSFSPTGWPQWALREGGVDRDYFNCVTTSPGDHVYLSGSFASQTLNIGTFNLANTDTSSTTSDILVARLDLVLGTLEEDKTAAISLLPNPTTGEIQISTPLDLPWTYAIYNSIGQLVFADDNVNAPTTKLDLSALPCGIYHVVVSSEETALQTQFIKQ